MRVAFALPLLVRCVACYWAAILGLVAQPVYAQNIASRSQVEDLKASLGATSGQDARPLKKLALTLIMHFEGWEAKPYDDPAGYCTIGYGHLIALKKCANTELGRFAHGVSKFDGEALLEQDTRSARFVINELVTRRLSDRQFGALTAFTFNVGKKNFANSTLLKLVNKGDDELAAAEFSRWIKADGKILKGLEERRACEAALYLERLKGDADGRFQRSECSKGLGATPVTGSLIDIDRGE